MEKRRIGGSALLLGAGAIFGRETLAYLWGGLLNLLTAGMGDNMSLDTFPWLNAAGTISFILGIGVLAWPWLKRVWEKSAIGVTEERVTEIVSERIDQIPLPNIPDYDEKLSQIEKDLKSISMEVSFLPALRGQLAENKQLRDDALADIRAQLRPLWGEYRKKRASALEALIAERRPRKPGSGDQVATMVGVGERMSKGMSLLGITQEQRNAAHDAAVSHIKSNALYCSLAPEDEGIWDDPTKKQAWYTADAKWEADLKLIRRARPSD